ncbi:hypothetical protein ACFSKL_11720 [Belliella marina]|uniref:Uncharacterized protein n=1 Tax=Belliella marina TaxID=1644146 RepID=A0ABW4VLE9_9BACT
MKKDKASTLTRGSPAFLLLIIAFFTFPGACFSNEAPNLDSHSIRVDEGLGILPETFFNPLDKTPFTPAYPESLPEELEDSDEKEKEVEEGFESIKKQLFPNIPFLGKIHSDYQSTSSQSRECIPLFILFHSWKSFLS